MTAYERLKTQIEDLAVRYDAGDAQPWPLMQRLLVLGPHERASQDVVGKIQPTSKPPGNLSARDLHDKIVDEALKWAWTLGGTRIVQRECMQVIPVLAGQRLDETHKERANLLHGQTGLYASVSRWHLSVRIHLKYDRPADRYPTVECPHCHHRDEYGAGSIRAHDGTAFCANYDCRDEQGRRHEWHRIVLEEFARDALLQQHLACHM